MSALVRAAELWIGPAATRADVEDARALVEEFTQNLGLDLAFQGLDEELATFPKKYAPPDGFLLLARVAGAPAGCVAYHVLDEMTCELKRLFVRPGFRGQGISRALIDCLLKHAKAQGYRRMVWDTLDTMTEALGLYRAMGAREIEPYYENPLPGARYFQLVLEGSQHS